MTSSRFFWSGSINSLFFFFNLCTSHHQQRQKSNCPLRCQVPEQNNGRSLTPLPRVRFFKRPSGRRLARPANPGDLWARMRRAQAAELLQLIKEASLRVILKTSCCVFSPHFCKSISERSGLLCSQLQQGPGLSPLLLVNLYQAAKTHKANLILSSN